jgi:acetyl-CoA carboxylase biotin carboxyl carrier protein
MKDVKITIKTNDSSSSQVVVQDPIIVPQPQPTPIVAPPTLDPTVTQENTTEEQSHLITVKSPIIGTFYRRSSPDKPSFVEVGDVVSEGTVLCVVEAMKLFNDIESEVSGKIIIILVDDTSPVEFDQPLFLIDPS